MLLGLTEGERHGYALKREIRQRTDGKLNLGSARCMALLTDAGAGPD